MRVNASVEANFRFIEDRLCKIGIAKWLLALTRRALRPQSWQAGQAGVIAFAAKLAVCHSEIEHKGGLSPVVAER